ncbi:Ubiquitinyl hydrolase 1 [Bertholletia excelsa]
MRLSRSVSGSERRQNQRLGSLRTRKKHKRLDAICEKAYNKNHRGVKTESNEYNVGGGSAGDESELRRSTRVRRAPVVLDSSPPPAKKRRRVDKRSGSESVGRGKKKDGLKIDSPCSTSRDVEEHGSWRSRLRSRAKNVAFGSSVKGGSSPRSKRKLFEDSVELGLEVKETGMELDDKEDQLECGMSTVVKSKRPGRIKASNFSRIAHQEETESCSDKEDDKEKNDVGENKENGMVEDKEKDEVVVLEDNDDEDPLQSKSGTGDESAHESEHEDQEINTTDKHTSALQPVEKEDGEVPTSALRSVEEEDGEVPTGLQLQDCVGDNDDTMRGDILVGLPELVDEGKNQQNSVPVSEDITDKVDEGGCQGRPLKDENGTKLHKMEVFQVIFLESRA